MHCSHSYVQVRTGYSALELVGRWAEPSPPARPPHASMMDYSCRASWPSISLLALAAGVLLVQISYVSGDLLLGRHFKLRGPPVGYSSSPSIKFSSKRIRPPVRVHHIHLNYPSPPHHPHPVKYISGPPRKYKPNIPIKSHFNPSPPAHFIAPIIDNNEGAIHTIPAPNLGPNGDRPIPPPALISSIAGAISPYENAIKVHPISQGAFEGTGYEVHETYYNEQLEPAKSNNNVPYYAPDPDPSVPAPQVPVTRDPHSHPSNGKAPFDLILQQQLEEQQQQQRVSLAHGVHVFNYKSDPNSQFLQAFQDQYRFPQQYDGEYHAQSSQHKLTAVPPDETSDVASHEADELDYDSGAEVRYSYSQRGHTANYQDQDDAASEHLEDDGEVIEDSSSFGQKIVPKSKNN
ncbi:UNVERIFIED_CONTAM: hypothetical protein B566_EDAN018163 [Ephemera danica]|nr:hypothetical protein B566_EDAN018163 [Ephemera danica]